MTETALDAASRRVGNRLKELRRAIHHGSALNEIASLQRRATTAYNEWRAIAEQEKPDEPRETG